MMQAAGICYPVGHREDDGIKFWAEVQTWMIMGRCTWSRAAQRLYRTALRAPSPTVPQSLSEPTRDTLTAVASRAARNLSDTVSESLALWTSDDGGVQGLNTAAWRPSASAYAACIFPPGRTMTHIAYAPPILEPDMQAPCYLLLTVTSCATHRTAGAS